MRERDREREILVKEINIFLVKEKSFNVLELLFSSLRSVLNSLLNLYPIRRCLGHKAGYH